ncbi:hypothetical protein [Streptomyces sioyaensis]|uniref:hypothetical protein n=1 Tax=Streptomyces sioyaensis TaxID=67364 RepID=UPI0036E59340
MMLRRYHQGEPSDTASDSPSPPSATTSDNDQSAPQADKPAGRSSSRSKTSKGG